MLLGIFKEQVVIKTEIINIFINCISAVKLKMCNICICIYYKYVEMLYWPQIYFDFIGKTHLKEPIFNFWGNLFTLFSLPLFFDIMITFPF